MYKILLFDDRLQVRVSLEKKFMSHGMQVFTCTSIDEACEAWDNHGRELDAIVLDIMIPAYGLPSEYRKETNKGQLTGWIWLWHQINPGSEEPHPANEKFIVIYSAYLNALDAYLSNKQENEAEKRFADLVKKIDKGDSKNEARLIELILQNRRNKKLF